ncbi:hypothetical protein BU23DRAFT_452038, partial [Bimuria novae-zelandiae CBS 107.79]
GGAFATRICVPEEQNSKFQGKELNSLRSRCNLQRGDKFVIRIDGGCKDVPAPVDWYLDPPEKRQLDFSTRAIATEKVDINGTDPSWKDLQGNGTDTFLALGLDQLLQGRYEVSVMFDGTVTRLSVADNSGEEYAAVDDSVSPATLQFTVEEDLYVPAALFVDTAQNISVTYTGSISPLEGENEPSSAPSGTASTTTPPRTSGCNRAARWPTFLSVLLVVALIIVPCV